MDVGISPVAQELDVTKLVFPNGPLIGLKSWDIRWADIMGRVSPLRLMNVSQAGEGGFSEDMVPPRRSLLVLRWSCGWYSKYSMAHNVGSFMLHSPHRGAK